MTYKKLNGGSGGTGAPGSTTLRTTNLLKK